MKLGAQLYTVRAHTQTPEDIAATLQKVASMGYQTVQASAMGPIEPARFRALLDENRLTCPVTHVRPDRFLNDLDGVIAEHKTIGCPNVGMGAMPEPYRNGLQGVRSFAADMGPVIQKLADQGLSFHYHNHDFEFQRVGKETLLDILLDLLPDAKLIMCAFWVQVGGGDPIQWYEKYASRIRVMHLKDMAFGGAAFGNGRLMTPVLEGNMNYPGLIDAIRRQGTTQYLMVEQDTCQGDPFDALRTSLTNLRALGLS